MIMGMGGLGYIMMRIIEFNGLELKSWFATRYQGSYRGFALYPNPRAAARAQHYSGCAAMNDINK